MPKICLEQGLNVNIKWIPTYIKRILQDRSIQKWSNHVYISSNHFSFESYITLPGKFKKKLTRSATSNYRLPVVEIGRWHAILI